jgi:NAD(P)-dependent dehydrogenase (short-subunit alcohol dehydrogenase family)
MQTLIIGSSGGIGAALLARGGVGLSRSGNGFDITSEASVAHHLGALAGPFDRIIVATGALEIDGARPEKSLKSLDSAAMAAQFSLNAIGPALVLKHALRLMPARSCGAVCRAVGAGWIHWRQRLGRLVRLSRRQGCFESIDPHGID